MGLVVILGVGAWWCVCVCERELIKGEEEVVRHQNLVVTVVGRGK